MTTVNPMKDGRDEQLLPVEPRKTPPTQPAPKGQPAPPRQAAPAEGAAPTQVIEVSSGTADHPGDRLLVREWLQESRCLADHLVEIGKAPETADFQTLAALWERSPEELTPQEVADLAVIYGRMMEQVGQGVTANTLRATCQERPGRISSCPAGRHLIRLWLGAVGVILLILVLNLIQAYHGPMDPGLVVRTAPPELQILHLLNYAVHYLEPFTYGTLGSIAYLLRVSETHLVNRRFDPERTPEHWNRLMLGTVSGGAIVLFADQIPSLGSTGLGNGVSLTAAALGFLAGYSVDFLFGILDRLIQAVLPKTEGKKAG